MKRLLLICFLVHSVFSNALQAQELPPSVFLNKITQRLIGSWPFPADYESLDKEMKSKNCSTVSCMDSYFRNYIKKLMNRPEFYAMFYGEVTERMGYKSPASPLLSQIILSGQDFQDPSGGRDFALVYRTLKDNRPFDELFTSQIITDPVYKTNDVSANIGAYDLSTIDVSKLRNVGQSTYRIELENGQTNEAAEYNLKDHPNIAGLFTTRKFLLRYWNSPLNQNRKRASAFFRIMMCDSMSPALERESQREKEMRLALGRSDEQVIVDEVRKVHADKHATQKDCAACHNRLDPIGKSMRGLEIGVSSEAFKGNLRFFNSSNEMADIPVNNFHDLITKTTAQPKYLDCQTNWMIEAFLGKDLNLPSHRFSEVVAQVEKRKRKLKDVVEDLLMIPEFRGLRVKVIEPASLIAAKAVLSNCTDCHSDTFAMRPEQMKSRLSRIAVCLDLPNESKGAQMPPSDHWWQPSAQEYAAVKSWIREGAPLTENSKLFEKNEVNQLLTPSQEIRKCRQ